MGLKYMPLFTDAYLADTVDLSLEEHGAYMKLLMCLWTKGGSIPFVHRKLAQVVGVGPKKWLAIWPHLEQFFTIEDGRLSSNKLSKVLAKSHQISTQQAASGSRGGAATALKNKKPPRKSAAPSESKSKEEGSKDPPSNAREVALAIWDEIPAIAKKRSSGKQLTDALESAAKRGKNLAVVRQAISGYYADPDTRRENHRYARGVHRVVQNDFWESWAHGSVAHLGIPDDGYSDEQKRRWMSEWIADPKCKWPWERGPRPNEPGCRIPLEIMAEFNYTPPARRQG